MRFQTGRSRTGEWALECRSTSSLWEPRDDSSLWEPRDDRLVEVILNLPGVADLGYDATRKRLLVPLTASSRVEIYDAP